MTQRAVLYARVSSDDRSKDGRNLAGQLEMGQKYAQEHGYQVVAELAEDDRGASGAEIDLPQLSRVRDMAAAGEFDVLVVREIDRLSRNLAKQLIVEQELKQAGVAMEYVIGEYPDTPEGDFQKHVKAVISEYERAKIKERSTRGRRLKVRAGHVIVHANPPYGYRLAEVDGKRALVMHETEARVVRMIFDWYTVGDGGSVPQSIKAVARKLSGLGIPTAQDKRGGRNKKRKCGQWSPGTLQHILSNETYAGLWHYGKERRDGNRHIKNPDDYLIAVEVPAIVERATWERAQTRREQNRRLAKRNRKYDYLLSGHATCGVCGLRMAGKSTWYKDTLYQYYICPATTGHAPRECCLVPFPGGKTDAVVWGWAKSFLTDPVALAEGLRAEQEEREGANAPLRDRLAVLDDLLADNRCQLERALDLYLSGDFDNEMLTERKARLGKTIHALERERAGLAVQLEAQALTDEQVQTITEFAQRVRGGLEVAEGDFEKRRRVIDLLDIQATLAVEDGEKVVYVRCIVGDGVLPIAARTSYSTCPGRECPPCPLRGGSYQFGLLPQVGGTAREA